MRYENEALLAVFLLVALVLVLLVLIVALILVVALVLVTVVLAVIVVLHEIASFRPIGYRHILDNCAGKYAFIIKRKKLLTNAGAAGKLNQQNKEG